MFGSLGVAGWNEYNNVATMKSINEGKEVIQQANCGPIQSHLEGQLVHVTCPLSNIQVLGQADPVLQGIPPEKRTGLALEAYMEVNQWIESVSSKTTTNNVGGGSTTTKTYSYSRQWSPSTPLQNTSFSNSGIKCESKNGGRSCLNWDPAMESWWSSSGYSLGATNIQYSTNVKAGNYTVPDEVIKYLGSPIVLTPSCSNSSITTNSSATTTITGTTSLACSPGGGSLRGTKMVWQKIDSNGQSIDYLTRSYTLRTADTISILAQQKGDSFVMWESSFDDDYGMFVFTAGNLTAGEMFAVEEANRVGLTWFLRALTLIGVISGLVLVTLPLTLVPDIIPCIGSYIGDLVGCVLWAVDCMLGSCCWSTVVAVCWLAYRPNIAIPLLCVSFGLAVLSIIAAVVNHRKNKEENSKKEDDGQQDDDEADIEVPDEEADIEVHEAYNPDYVEDEKKR